MANLHDDAIDKLLAALKNAAPPEGMEARIGARLAQQLQHPPKSSLPWLGLSVGSTVAGAWWRGALSGAAAATFAICALLLVQHRSQAPRPLVQAIVRSYASTPVSTSPHAPFAGQPHAAPCASPTILRVQTNLLTTPAEALGAETSAESFAPSRPAPELPMTAQERELARLARTADPRELATLNPETQARLEAEDAAAFAKFFTPPPPPPLPPPLEASPQANSEASPQVPEASPETNPEEKPQPSSQPASPEVVPPTSE